MNNHINLDSVRDVEQQRVMERIRQDGVCPFCREHFEKYHSKPILFETAHWITTENAWPYENAIKHFLLVAKTHITKPSDLSPDAWLDLQRCLRWLENEKQIDHGTLLMRFGNTKNTGGSVTHLHAQLVVAESPEKPVRTRIG